MRRSGGFAGSAWPPSNQRLREMAVSPDQHNNGREDDEGQDGREAADDHQAEAGDCKQREEV